MYNLVIGASLKPYRYSNMAIKRLRDHGLEVKAIGLREGEVEGVGIDRGQPKYEGIDTVLMYINPQRQPEYYELHMQSHQKLARDTGLSMRMYV